MSTFSIAGITSLRNDQFVSFFFPDKQEKYLFHMFFTGVFFKTINLAQLCFDLLCTWMKINRIEKYIFEVCLIFECHRLQV